MAVVKKISELVPKGSALGVTDLLVVGVDNGTDYDLKSVTGAQLLGTVVSQTITDGVTTKSPSENVVYDNLALKVDKELGHRLITSGEATILDNTSGVNTGDQDLSGYVKTTTNQTIDGQKTFNSGTVHESGLRIKHGTQILSTGYTGIGANVNSLIIGMSGFQKTLSFPEISNYIYTFPSSTGTLSLTSDLTSKVDGNTAITGATKTKITYDSKGLVTSGTDATTSDIADSLNKRYVTDANLTTIGNTSGTNTGDQIISDATLTTTDITTNNVSSTKHGFAPKTPNNTTTFLRGDGTWATPSAGGLTYFTEAQNTTAPNATVPVDSLTAVASTTDADFSILAKGTGAILASIPNSITNVPNVGGNKRGQYALDLQHFGQINAVTEVASGNYSAIVAGTRNTASSANDTVLNGSRNTASGGTSTVINGLQNNASGGNSFIGNGQVNTASGGAYATVINGYGCTSNASYAISAGFACNASGSHSVSFGDTNVASGSKSSALNSTNTASSDYSNARGYNATTFTTWGKWALGGGGATLGSAQKGMLVLTVRTTTNTATEISFGANGVDARANLTCQDNNGMRVKGSIIGKQSGSTNISAWDFDYVIVRGVGVGTTSVVVSNVNVVTNTPAWGTPTITADTSRGYASIKVTGVSTTNIQWTATIESTEVIYA